MLTRDNHIISDGLSSLLTMIHHIGYERLTSLFLMGWSHLTMIHDHIISDGLVSLLTMIHHIGSDRLTFFSDGLVSFDQDT